MWKVCVFVFAALVGLCLSANVPAPLKSSLDVAEDMQGITCLACVTSLKILYAN